MGGRFGVNRWSSQVGMDADATLLLSQHEHGCPHASHCPHLGGAALGTLVGLANENQEERQSLFRTIDAQREQIFRLVAETRRLDGGGAGTGALSVLPGAGDGPMTSLQAIPRRCNWSARTSQNVVYYASESLPDASRLTSLSKMRCTRLRCGLVFNGSSNLRHHDNLPRQRPLLFESVLLLKRVGGGGFGEGEGFSNQRLPAALFIQTVQPAGAVALLGR